MPIRVTTISSGGPGARASLRRPLGLWLVLAACFSAFFGFVLVHAHMGPPAEWERVEATVLKHETVYVRGIGIHQRMQWFVRASYLADWQGRQIVCAWDDTVLPGFRDIAQSMLQSPDAFAPLGARTMLGLDPANRGNCMPEDGWNALAVCQAAALFGLAALLALAGILLLRRPTRGV